jgi:hypothetical protein
MTKKNGNGKNKNGGGNLFGPEVFADDWIIVTDRNGCDIQVTVDDIFEFPTHESNIEVIYDGQPWWIDKNLHFPM